MDGESNLLTFPRLEGRQAFKHTPCVGLGTPLAQQRTVSAELCCHDPKAQPTGEVVGTAQPQSPNHHNEWSKLTMNNRIVTSVCVLSAIFFAVQGAFPQGALTPPGPPAPTMLTLTQIEPRTPITNLPYIITSPGSYYVTTNLTCTTCTSFLNGIQINTNDVTLDLSGFTLKGVAGSASGIYVNNPQGNIA